MTRLTVTASRRIAKILEPLGNDIVAVFFDVDEG
jgi:hypothetical protein